MKRFTLPSLVCAALLAAFLPACGNSDADPAPSGGAGTSGATEATLTSLQANLFTPSCALSGCHSSTDPENGLDLSAGKSFASLTTGTSPQAPELKRVDTATPENSLIYKTLLGEVKPASGGDAIGKMPDNGKVIPQAQIDAVKAWIAAGAKND